MGSELPKLSRLPMCIQARAVAAAAAAAAACVLRNVRIKVWTLILCASDTAVPI